MNTVEEPSYLAFSRAAVRNKESVPSDVVRALLARIDRDASALAALRNEAAVNARSRNEAAK